MTTSKTASEQASAPRRMMGRACDVAHCGHGKPHTEEGACTLDHGCTPIEQASASVGSMVYVAGKMRPLGDCLTCSHTRAAHTDGCSCHHTECDCPNYTWYASDQQPADTFSYDSYTEGQYMAVLTYLIGDGGSGPHGRDELAEWVLERVTEHAAQAQEIARLKAALEDVERLLALAVTEGRSDPPHTKHCPFIGTPCSQECASIRHSLKAARAALKEPQG